MTDFSIYPNDPKLVGSYYMINFGKHSGRNI